MAETEPLIMVYYTAAAGKQQEIHSGDDLHDKNRYLQKYSERNFGLLRQLIVWPPILTGAGLDSCFSDFPRSFRPRFSAVTG